MSVAFVDGAPAGVRRARAHFGTFRGERGRRTPDDRPRRPAGPAGPAASTPPAGELARIPSQPEEVSRS
ncbi:hypothetical protein FRACA_2710006 [Frankia canadensis]|uniref:Uncharacterized protein n=1 Tax=Frankia canadensis TaxID=1836972 RepID=A0A2I2KSS3_9ACTN|nr:hypothetical protein FRACA_2710006 [Frankia canadensis]SOU56015.1 hypothetical protein FRACA_2710006 [Frankia canadensis]